jgi:hypothetical protein
MSQDQQQRFIAWRRLRLAAPALELTPDKRRTFDDLLAAAVQRADDRRIEYTCAYPKHEFLRYMVESRSFLLHGSRTPDISVFQPIRLSSDTVAFGRQAAVYAASDSIWPIVFAILDRQVYRGVFHNECSRVELDGRLSPPFYTFALEAAALARRPWTDGTVYLMPRESFTPRPPDIEDGLTVYCQEWVSRAPVEPIAQLAVGPDDFPFLDECWGFDAETLLARLGAYPETWPFGDLDDAQLYPIRPASWRSAGSIS